MSKSFSPILDVHRDVSYCVGGFGEGLDHPECVAWGCDGYAYAGGEAGQIYRIDIENGVFEQFAETPGFVGGICQDGSRNLYACSSGSVFRITPQGFAEVYSRGSESVDMTTPNYPVFGPDGSLYVSDSGEWGQDNGRIFRVSPTGETEVWSEDVRTFPNGLAISPGGDFLYVAVSLNKPRIERISIASDGSSGNVEGVTFVPGSVPDGLAFDNRGDLYISCYRPDRIYRLTSTYGLEILADDLEGTLMAAPTNIAFCGNDRKDFLSANLGRWHISRYDLSEIDNPEGAALNYPALMI